MLFRSQILDSLAEAGIPDGIVVGISQGWKLGGAIKTTERKLAEGVLVHGDQPLMAWCVGNARVEPKGNAILITKQASGRGKIDPLMALFNAVSLMNKFRSRFPGRRQVSRVTPHTIQHGLWWHPLAQSGLPGTESGFLRVCPGTQRVLPPDLFEHIRIIHSSHRLTGVFRDYPIGFPLNGGIGFPLIAESASGC